MPRAIAHHPLGRAVGIGNLQLQDQFGRAERADKLCIPPGLLNVIHPVAQPCSDGVCAIPQQSRYIIGQVQISLAVVRPTRFQDISSDFPTIHMELKLAKTANVDHSPLPVGPDAKLAAQNNGRVLLLRVAGGTYPQGCPIRGFQ